ncbi:hypothetical protein HOA93_06165 [bacterium]|nr:hypothetical protein [bacterium]
MNEIIISNTILNNININHHVRVVNHHISKTSILIQSITLLLSISINQLTESINEDWNQTNKDCSHLYRSGKNATNINIIHTFIKNNL